MVTRRTAVLGVSTLALGALVAAGAQAITRGSDVAWPATPQAKALTYRAVVPDEATRPGFTIRLPQPPATTRVDAQSELTVRISGTHPGMLTLTRFPQAPTDPVAAVRELRAASQGRYRVGPIRRTTLTGQPAAFTVLTIGSRQVVEYRFVHDGVTYGAGIVSAPGDAVVLDTARAALATWTWLS